MKILLTIALFINILFSKELDKITLQLQWKHQFESAGFYMAKEKGFYEDAGLDVSFIEFNSNINIIDKVIKTPNMYGITYSNIVSEYLKGKPIIFVANFFKQSPLAIITTKDIKEPSDLIGKRVMGIGTNINSAMELIMFKKFGIKKDDFIHIDPTFRIDEFVNKKIDAMTVYTTNETFFLDQLGIEYNILNPTIYGAEFYDVNLFTSKDELKLHPNRVLAFKNASVKGWEYALTHQKETIDLILKKYNTQHKSIKALQYEAKQIKNIMLPDIYKIGSIDKNRIKLMIENFKELGLTIQNKELILDNFVFKDNKYNIKLTKIELSYLKKHNIIKVHNELDWAPYNYNLNGIPKGFSIDYMNLLASKVGINIKYINGYKWYEFLNMIKNNKLDVMLNIAKTKERENFLSYTTSYSNMVDSVIIKKSDKKYKKLSDFNGKTIAIVKGFFEEELLKKYYPKIKLYYVSNSIDALKAVIFNKADGTINSLGVAQYSISKYQITNLIPAFNIKDKRFNLELHLATSINNKILRNILEKGKKQISQEELKNLNNKWFSINKKDKLNYILALNILGFIIFIIILIIFWNIKLNQKVKKEIQKNNEQESLIHYYSKQESMKNMLGNISHQWRHPLSELSSTIMFLDTKLLLNQNITNADIKDMTTNSKNIINFMSKTIDTFNNFYKKVSDDENNHFIIKDAIEETLFILKGSFELNNINVKLEIDKKLEIFGNINQFEQVILSILVNSQNIFIKRDIKQRCIIISVYTTKSNIFIDINDNAKGIQLKNINDIFKLSVSENGTGLGLFISKNIIETKFKGDIIAFNQNNGATVRIKLVNI